MLFRSTNYILLGCLTVCQAGLLYVNTYALNSKILIEASVLTAVMVTLAYVFAKQTRFDFTDPKFLIYFNLSHLAALFLTWIVFPSSSVIWAYLGALVMLIYIVVDLHMIMGDKNYKLTVDDHVYASMILYIDIVTLLLKIIEILKKEDSSRDKKR